MKFILFALLWAGNASAFDLKCVILDSVQSRGCTKKVQCFTLYENEPKTNSLCEKDYSVATEHYADTVLIRVVDNRSRKDVARTTRDAKDGGMLTLNLEKPKVTVSCSTDLHKECAEPAKRN
jgi:hypothetical protein